MANMDRWLVLLLTIASTITIGSSRMRRLSPETHRQMKQHIELYDDVPHYPEEIAERLFDQLVRENKAKYFLNAQILHELHKRRVREDQKARYVNLCPSRKQMYFSRFVVIDDKEYYVLNPNSNKFQAIEMEICKERGCCCKLVQSAGFDDHTCTQEYAIRDLYVMARDDPEKLLSVEIEIPSCCSCTLKY